MKLSHLAAGALLLAATPQLAQAQTSAGTLLLSGNINYYSTTSTVELYAPNPAQLPRNETHSQQLVFSPAVGFFVADNLAVGLSAGVQSGRNSATQTSYIGFGSPPVLQTLTSSEQTRSLSVGPFVRYYHMLGDKAGFYGQLAGGYEHSYRKQQIDDYTPNPGAASYTSNGGYASLKPGFVFFPTPRFGLELTLGGVGYSRSATQSRDLTSGATGPESTSSSFAADFGLQTLTLGAAFHLGR